MKYLRFKLMAVMALVVISVMPASARDIFESLAGMTGVETTFVSGKFGHNYKYWYNSNGEAKMNLSRGFSALYSYTCTSTESVTKARKILDAYIKSNKDVELMLRKTEGHSEYRVYEKLDGDKIYQVIIFDYSSPNSCDVAVIDYDEGLESSAGKKLNPLSGCDFDFDFDFDIDFDFYWGS